MTILLLQADALSKFLHQQELTPWMTLAAVGVVFALGAAHALTPGHGKTIVAAYLVGSRGTIGHAVFLGAIVTFTHTVSVFLLGLATMFLFQYVVPEKVTQVLGAISGLSILAIGGWMLYKRIHAAGDPHHHDHHHGHDHHHHAHQHHDHDHAHTHTHMPEEISWPGLVALGASGRLVSCESALVLLLSAIALRRVGLGLLLLVSFSFGLAIVLMAVEALVIYAKHLLPKNDASSRNPFWRWLPVASATVVMVVGILMTCVSLGWIQPKWMVG